MSLGNATFSFLPSTNAKYTVMLLHFVHFEFKVNETIKDQFCILLSYPPAASIAKLNMWNIKSL